MMKKWEVGGGGEEKQRKKDERKHVEHLTFITHGPRRENILWKHFFSSPTSIPFQVGMRRRAEQSEGWRMLNEKRWGVVWQLWPAPDTPRDRMSRDLRSLPDPQHLPSSWCVSTLLMFPSKASLFRLLKMMKFTFFQLFSLPLPSSSSFTFISFFSFSLLAP